MVGIVFDMPSTSEVYEWMDVYRTDSRAVDRRLSASVRVPE